MYDEGNICEKMADLTMIRQYWYNIKFKPKRDRFYALGDWRVAKSMIGSRIRDGIYNERLSEKDRDVLYTAGGDLLCYARDLEWSPSQEEIINALEALISDMEQEGKGYEPE